MLLSQGHSSAEGELRRLGDQFPQSLGNSQGGRGTKQGLLTEKHQMNRNHQPIPAPASTALTPAKPVSLCSDGFVYPTCLPCPSPHIQMLPSLQHRALISSCQHLAGAWHRQAFEQEVLSLFPEPKLPPHFISTSLWAPSSSYLGLDSCSRLERIIILTAGVRTPLRGNCLCPGKYFS